ncbi:mechanosensitive ion channel family protein [Aquimarina sp. ERC-38]|uniref:mechanosensitive ion channel family protein n=1 Tax=Aquimarina sp. ERC-38 TaxID=2949996 RepID=UPI002246E7A6|nr:mechanosensitive ion channel family protein [Aquimarina sp. ERC-38]UZO79841.1 mechanosensitive ion channel family protein [Aquimarina sp. ERC-38]
METWFTNFTELSPIWHWGFGLLIGFPLLVVLLNEIGYFATQRDPHLGKPIQSVRNFILPLGVLVILLVRIFNFDRDSLAINILETLIGVLAINTGLTLVTRFFFSKDGFSLFSKNVPQLFLDIIRVFLVLVGSAILLSAVWNVELGGLVTALGLGSFVLGLALQDTLGNLFSGIALVYEKPFEVGDYIKVDERYGKVIEMNWRAVHILTREKELIVIPHLMVGQNVIMNFSKPTKVHIIKQIVNFSYQDPPNTVKEALLNTCLNTPGILDHPEPEVKTNTYGDSAIQYEVEFGINSFEFHEEITDAFMTRVWYAAQRYHLTIPYPQLTLHRAENTIPPKETYANELDKKLKELPSQLPLESYKKSLAESGRILYFGAGEIIIRQGDATGVIYILIQGEIELLIKGNTGKDILVNTISEGDFFGEVALLSGRRSSMTAKAKNDVKAVKLTPDEVRNMVSNNQNLAYKMDEVMDSRRKSAKKQAKKEGSASGKL